MTVPGSRVQHIIEPSYSPVSPSHDDNHFTDEDAQPTTSSKRVRSDVQESPTAKRFCKDDDDSLERFRACIDEKGWQSLGAMDAIELYSKEDEYIDSLADHSTDTMTIFSQISYTTEVHRFMGKVIGAWVPPCEDKVILV